MGSIKGREQTFRRNAIGVDEALDRLKPFIKKTAAEEIDIFHALGRRAAFDIIAGEDVPHFRRSGFDGYAVRSADTVNASASSPVRLEVIDTVACGSTPNKPVTSGRAIRIMTGAMVPEGADAVVMLEAANEAEGGHSCITLTKPVSPQANISAVGSDIASGTTLLESGRKLGPAEIALLATLGCATVKVFARPRVAVLSTGTELLPLTAPLQMGKIRNSNAYMLAAQIQRSGGVPSLIDTVPDALHAAKRAITDAMVDADLIVTSGGVSVGDYDVMAELFLQWEGETLFNKIRMRPGSPTSAGVLKDKLIIALSGNPGACFVGFELLVHPVLMAMQGTEELRSDRFAACMADDYLKVNAYTRYIRGSSYNENGRVMVKPSGQDQSSRLLPSRDADCLIVIPPGGAGIKAGDQVTAIRLEP